MVGLYASKHKVSQSDNLQDDVCVWKCGNYVFHVVDAILIPTPFYGVITEDLDLYSDVKLFHVPLDCEVGIQSLIYLYLRNTYLCVCVYL